VNCKHHTQIFNSVEHRISTVSAEDGIIALHYFHHSPYACRELGRFPHCVRNTRYSLVLCWFHEETDNFVAPEIICLTAHQISRLFY